MGGPAVLWLAVFFLVPLVTMLSLSVQTCDSVTLACRLTWHFAEFPDVIREFSDTILRSFVYAGAATLATLIVSFPVTYWIAFRAKRKNFFLLMLLLPFFVSFVIRILTWQFILADQGIVLGTLKDIGLLPSGFHVLSTPAAVIAGLTYDALPFMALPIYVALENIDRTHIEAAADLGASRFEQFLRVVLPLSAPGVYAGILLVAITNIGDYVSAAILGGPSTTMIGNIIQTQYVQNANYPTASALALILMAALLLGMWVYTRAFGTRTLQEYV